MKARETGTTFPLSAETLSAVMKTQFRYFFLINSEIHCVKSVQIRTRKTPYLDNFHALFTNSRTH